VKTAEDRLNELLPLDGIIDGQQRPYLSPPALLPPSLLLPP
jgi:hypothetical protein